ncbi:MAG TPA: gamma carbonic anhydrase family protein [Candidatus Methylomirabilis sp.]|nr:gamma carbonic anhydrase family protein [Candidatus Methylomirabilis sp.]
MKSRSRAVRRPGSRRGAAAPAEDLAVRGVPFGRHRPRIDPSAFVTEGTWVVGRVTIGRRASIWFGAVLRGDFAPIRVGPESLIEDNCVLHGRVVVGRRCVIGHGAILHGCTVGDGAVIGANAVVFDGARIGAHALVAAGSVVYPGTRVPPRVVFRNSPGGNHPSVEPIRGRLRRWPATAYRGIVVIHRARHGGPGSRSDTRARPPEP